MMANGRRKDSTNYGTNIGLLNESKDLDLDRTQGRYIVQHVREFCVISSTYLCHRPIWTAVVGVLFVIAIGYGFGLRTVDLRPEYLHGFQDTKVWDEFQEHNDLFVGKRRLSSVMLSLEDSRSNILQSTTFRLLYQDWIFITENLTTSDGVSYETACERRGTMLPCNCSSLFFIFNYNETLINNASNQDILAQVNKYSANTAAILGGVTFDSNGLISKATSTIFSFGTSQVNVAQAEAFEDALYSWAEDRDSFFKMAAITPYNKELESENNVTRNWYIIWISISTCLLIAIMSLGSWSTLHSRFALGLAVGYILLGVIAMSFGFCAYIGLNYTSYSIITILVAISLGISNTLVFVSNFKSQPNLWSCVDRITESHRTIGPCLFALMILGLSVFICGVFLQSLSFWSFSVTAIMIVFFLWVLQYTIFCGFLPLDDWRIRNGRCDLLPCVVSKPEFRGAQVVISEDNFLERTSSKIFLRFYTQTHYHVLVGIIFLGLILGTTPLLLHIDVGISYQYYYTDDAPIHSYFDNLANLYDNPVTSMEAIVRKVNYTDIVVQDKLIALPSCMIKKGDMALQESWFSAFRAWAEENEYSIIGQDFYPRLLEFLDAGNNRRFKQDLIINQVLEASRINMFIVFSDNPKTRVDNMNNAKACFKELDLDGFPYAEYFVISGRDEVALDRIDALIGGGIAAAFGALCFFVEIRAALITVICAALPVVETAAYALSGMEIPVDTGSSISLFLVLGLSVHHCGMLSCLYYNNLGDRVEMTRAAFTSVVPSLILSCCAYICGCLPLLFATSEIFRQSFKIQVLAMALIAAHVVVLQPILLLRFAAPRNSALVVWSDSTTQPRKCPERLACCL